MRLRSVVFVEDASVSGGDEDIVCIEKERSIIKKMNETIVYDALIKIKKALRHSRVSCHFFVQFSNQFASVLFC